MTTPLVYLIGLFLIPLTITFFAGYGRLQPGPFLGFGVAGGALSSFFTYLLVDFASAAIQFGALAVGGLLYVGTIGLFGGKFSYRSPMVLFSATALFPWGLIISQGSVLSAALWTYVGLVVVSVVFALLLALARRGVVAAKGKTAKPRFILVVPVILGTLMAALLTFTALNL